MARHTMERTFEPNKTVVARRNFIAAGRHYQPGMLFDWRRLSVATRRVWQMYEAGLIMNGDPTVVEEKPIDEPAVNSDLPDVEEIDRLIDLQEIAKAEGAAIANTKLAQRQAILENRAKETE